MLKIDRITFLFIASVILVLALGQSCVNASDVDSNDTITQDNVDDAVVSYSDVNPKTEDSEYKTIDKNVKENVKNSPELEPVSLSMNDVEADFGDVVYMNVLTDPVVDEGILSWYIQDSIVGVRNLSNAPASMPIETVEYRPGTYTVEVTYTGSLLHQSTSTTATLKINPVGSYVTNVVSNFNDENNIDITLNVIGGDEILTYGEFNVYRGDDLIKSLEIEDEDVSFVIGKEYNNEVLTFEWIGDEYYLTSRTDYFISIPKFKSNIYMSYPNGYQGSVINQTVTFYSDRLVNDGVLDIYVDGVLIDEYSVTGNDVNVSFDLEEYGAGVYDVYLDYYGSDVYEDSDYATVLTVRQINTTLYTYNVTCHKKDTVYLRAGVYNYVDDTSEGMVEFFIDDESVQTVWVSNIDASVEYVIPENLEYGEHELRVVYHGSNRYAGSSGLAVLNVTRYSNSLSLRNSSLDDDGRIVINVREYSYNQTVDDGMLEYYVDGLLVGSVPVMSNITEIILPDVYEGDVEYELTVKYVNSQKFDNATLTTTLNVSKINTTNRLYTYINGSNILNLTSYIYGSNYEEINEGIVEFYINNTLIGTATVTDNMANILYDMDSYIDNTYNIHSVYTGSKLYRTSENNTNINYTRNKKNTYIQTANTIKEKPGNTITITVNLTDYEGNKIPAKTQINVTILEHEYPLWTENGEITLTYTIPANTSEGQYNISIKTSETKDYKSANRTIKLNVYKDTPYITGQNIIRAVMGENILINATLNLNHEKLVTNMIGLVKINNKTVYQGMFNGGNLQFPLVLGNKYTDTEYNITIKSIENSQYRGAEKNILLQLSPRNTYITSRNIKSKNGEQIIINATIYDSKTHTPVKGTGKVCLKINEVTLDNINITNGHVLYAYTNNYSAKDYNIKIIYGRNNIYSNSTWNGTLSIASNKLRVTAHNIQTYAYKTITIRANILAENKLATGPINTAIKINNKTIHEEIVTNGKITFNYTLPDDIGSGQYNLTIIAGDTRKYTGNTTTVNLTVNKNYKKIQTNNITAKPGDNISIRAKIVDKDNNPVDKATKINIKIAGHTITDYNITDGNIEYNYTLPEHYTPGNYDILIQAGETSGFYHATAISTLKIE